MTHSITALIGQSEFMGILGARLDLPRPTPLGFGLSLIPWLKAETHESLEPFQVGEKTRTVRLDPDTERSLHDASIDGQLLLIATAYFGGFGGQGAVMFQGGETVHGPNWADAETINEALELMGVQATDDKDQFDLLGLGRHRHTAGWLNQAER